MSEKFTCDISTKRRVNKGDDDQSLQGAKMARRISRLIERKPDVLQTRPEWGKYKDAEAQMQERAAQTREEHRQERPGPVHEDLKQGDGTEKSRDQFVITDVAKGKDGHVSSVAVLHKDALLMGKRRDNGRWTLPGGHLDSGEDPHEGGKRELKEEAGIEADKLHHLKSATIRTHTGKEKTIHAFKYEVSERPKTSMVLDPDQEVERWKWIKHKNGKLPEHVSCNLHSPKNLVLESLNMKSGAFFIIDLMKGMHGHKYIRKYQRNGKWIYIYHEPGHHGRRMDDQHIEDLHALAEHGDEHAKSVVEAIEEGDQNVIDDIIALAEHGDEHAKQMMRDYGLKKKDDEKPEKKDELSKLERTVTQAENNDPVDKDLEPQQRSKAIEAVKKEIEEVKRYLAGHATSPITRAFETKYNEALEMVSHAKTVREVMTAAHNVAKHFEQAQGQLSSQNGQLQQHGGTYGNMIYNRALDRMAQAGIFPQTYADEHKREARGNQPEVKSLREHAERAARAEAERAERERRELGELQGSMAYHMASIMEGGGGRDRVAKARELDQAIKNIFGRSLTKEDWPYNFEANGLTTKIRSVSAHGNSISMSFSVYDSEGNQIMKEWSREWSKEGGRPHIYNSYMAVKPEFRNGAKVGDLINKGQRELMRRQPRGGTVGVTAALDVGGYNWANQGFSFSDQSTLRSMRQSFQLFCAEKGIHLTNEDMDAFTEPVHFAAFSDGKKYIKQVNQYKLTPSQIENGELAPGHPLTSEERRSGNSTRMACHLGKAFLLGRSWRGIWDSRENNATTRYADSYGQLRERAVKHLEQNYRNVSEAAQSGERTRAPARETRVTPRSSVSQGDTERVSQGDTERVNRYINYWTPRGGGGTGRANIRMTKSRVQQILRWSPADITHFLANAPITPAARRAIAAGMRNR